ncbi:MAG: hypothetical protein HYY24_00920 [Verrucomicrobia bacterium]|nr:hypothetical protein [Verrucomicrobiota bacterium]
MNDEGNPPAADSGGLQFDRAEFTEATAGALTCVACQQPIAGAYFQINDKMICPPCREKLAAGMVGGSGAARFLRALTFGVVAAALGAGIYFGISALTGYEFGLVAIVVGLMVGWAVRRGAEARGGWVYQGLAMLLTYLAIVATYVPYVVKGIREGEAQQTTAMSTNAVAAPTQTEAAPEATAEANAEGAARAPGTRERSLLSWVVVSVLVLAIACAAPFLAGLENLIGWIIIAIGLYEAWKFNKRPALNITGPFQTTAGGAAPPAASSA